MTQVIRQNKQQSYYQEIEIIQILESEYKIII